MQLCRREHKTSITLKILGVCCVGNMPSFYKSSQYWVIFLLPPLPVTWSILWAPPLTEYALREKLRKTEEQRAKKAWVEACSIQVFFLHSLLAWPGFALVYVKQLCGTVTGALSQQWMDLTYICISFFHLQVLCWRTEFILLWPRLALGGVSMYQSCGWNALF